MAASNSRTITASEFKAKCLQLMDEVAATAEEIVITKNGRPVSRLMPYREKPKSLFGIDRDIIQIHGDITEPIDVEWEAEFRRNWDLPESESGEKPTFVEMLVAMPQDGEEFERWPMRVRDVEF